MSFAIASVNTYGYNFYPGDGLGAPFGYDLGFEVYNFVEIPPTCTPELLAMDEPCISQTVHNKSLSVFNVTAKIDSLESYLAFMEAENSLFGYSGSPYSLNIGYDNKVSFVLSGGMPQVTTEIMNYENLKMTPSAKERLAQDPDFYFDYLGDRFIFFTSITYGQYFGRGVLSFDDYDGSVSEAFSNVTGDVFFDPNMYNEYLQVIAKIGTRPIAGGSIEGYPVDLYPPYTLYFDADPMLYGQYYNKYWEEKIKEFVSNDVNDVPQIRSLNGNFDRIYEISEFADIIKHEDASMIDASKNFYLLSEDIAPILFQDYCKARYIEKSASARYYDKFLTKACKDKFRDIYYSALSYNFNAGDQDPTFLQDAQDQIDSGSVLQGQELVDRYREVMIRCSTNSAEAAWSAQKGITALRQVLV
mmetsp:Transcript_22199/g.27442  ORF Transcript_22199/g.27442 Transcript_22199/m.27442 type:complete len:416 (+) Transcript_22199:132-1379(+)|eukprot:CAMPEP_0172498298 /NCGR_PEP_ID=MMETSP1066-20121228/111918_1 /TAXON_ID=671091 /ORGANISM="Coscinodiscus wailesii, Strain CCMP2513" /LENGTH=415 /DNA_ID=CAMNT_0013271523 /DNA_START=129 /DNA_END=1376 /DNA_ORIENTATION=+